MSDTVSCFSSFVFLVWGEHNKPSSNRRVKGRYLFSLTMERRIQLAIFALSCFILLERTASGSIWTWRCTGADEIQAQCLKERAKQPHDPQQISLATCKLTCGKYGSLVPRPQKSTIGKFTTPFLPSNIESLNVLCQANICPLLDEAVGIMNTTINMYHPDHSETAAYWLGPWNDKTRSHKLVIELSVSGKEEFLDLTTDESYTLKIMPHADKTKVAITANTFFGARHALETLSQLIDFDDEHNSLQVVVSAAIEDGPIYPYRGFIIDTARNYMSVARLKRLIEAMSYNKMNTFHWHITDTHSFPLALSSLPNMATFGAYSDSMIYSPSDVRDIVKFARVRGVRVLPEFDAPAHVGHGWEWGEEKGLGKLVVCLNKKPWTSYCVEPPCGQLNLANDNIYSVLGAIFNELVDMFSPLSLFHYGGDEVNLNCWNTSSEVTQWMVEKGFGLSKDAYFKQWSVFQEKTRNLLTAANKGKEVKGIIWTSKLTEKGRVDQYLDKNKYVIQIWTTGTDPLIKELLQKGYQVIFSNYDALYFDCGVSSWVGKGTNWCSPYKGWQDVYDNDIEKIAFNLTKSHDHRKQILGGEAALWTEQADGSTLDAKVWPRGSALAERLWTNPPHNYTHAEARMLQHRHRMVTRGILAARLQPEWCRHNQGDCPWVDPLEPGN